MLNATLIRADELLLTDTIFIGNFRYAVQSITADGDVYSITIDTDYTAVILSDTQVWVLERTDPGIHDEDTYEEMREAAAMEKLTGECPITETTDCKSRDCELHYMRAPLRLEFCPVCGSSQVTMPHTPHGPEWCTDIYAGVRNLGF